MAFPSFFAKLRGVMSPLIKILLEGGSLSTAQMAQVLNLPEAEVNRQLEQLRKDRVLLGWRPVLNLVDEDTAVVRAVIEVRITPERGGGFNRLADRISRFDEVESCYLMSGDYDLLVFVSGTSLQKVAAFVSRNFRPSKVCSRQSPISSSAPTRNRAFARRSPRKTTG
jgi:DNA-binding Lrp family transcriptional regulator